jgi:hypothetical protein
MEDLFSFGQKRCEFKWQGKENESEPTRGKSAYKVGADLSFFFIETYPFVDEQISTASIVCLF